MSSPVSYALDDGLATIAMDDGKANVMTLGMLSSLNEAFDQAERDRAVVLLTGRTRMFSGGYDLQMFSRSRSETVRTIRAGGMFVTRVFGFPYPVVAACTGHAIAQGAFTLMGCDVRVGAAGAFKIGLNEVLIGLTIPHYGVEVSRARLSPSSFNVATLTGAFYSPAEALAAGFLDRVVDESDVAGVARDAARQLTKIDMGAHAGTKKRVRAASLAAMRAGIEVDFPCATP